MLRDKYIDRFTRLQKYKLDLTTRKNADYASGGDAFQNFSLIEVITSGRISTAAGILVRMTDKLQRIANLLAKPPEVVGEAIEDSCVDLANYSDILNIYLSQKQEDEVWLGGNTQSAAVPEQLPLGFEELPPDVPQQTIDETFDGLMERVTKSGVKSLTATERSYLELVIKMRLQLLDDSTGAR